MEESGHYYTVYFTSLAVGFSEQVAYIHALLAQMPDEVGWLDAANMHMRQCLVDLPWEYGEYDLKGSLRLVPGKLRYLFEYTLHSLGDKARDDISSEFQRSVTQKLLSAEDPLSLKFGLLLHRLGDTFAHSVMGNEKEMYEVDSSGSYFECLRLRKLGHAVHFHDPDYPFLRQPLFYDYLAALYKVLLEKRNSKAREPGSTCINRNKSPIPLAQLQNIFRYIFDDQRGSVYLSMKHGYSKGATQAFFIMKIREQARSYLETTLKPYRPEDIEKQILAQFLSDHQADLFPMGINESTIMQAVDSINTDLRKAKK